MKPWRRIALGSAAGAALLIIAGAIALHALVDPERLKQQVRDKAREAWSRDVAIGEVWLQLLPLPSLHASGVTLADAPGDKDPWHLHAERVSMDLELWPLLKGEARPRGMHIEGDITRHGRRMKVIAALDDVSGYGQPGATSNGVVDLDWGDTRVTAKGRIPLHPQLRDAAFTGHIESRRLNDMLGFFGIERPRATAPARASLEWRSVEDRFELHDIHAVLGKVEVTGDARVWPWGPTSVVETRLQTGFLDWGQAMIEAGEKPLDPLPPDEMFYDNPIAWPLLVALHGKRGTIEAQLGTLRLRNGLELRQAKASMAFEGDELRMKSFTATLLGGSAKGAMRFEGRKKAVHVDIEGKGLLLERWFAERHRDVPFTGGPMAISASLVATGDSMRDLSKSMTGPVTIRMGPGVYASQKAGDAEAVMVAFSKKDSAGHIAFECAGFNLPFVQGRATGNAIAAARTEVSRLLASGYVSLRDRTVDLRGRLRPKPGMGVGLAAIDGDIRISGNFRELKTRLDPAGTPKAAVRGAVAVATLGLSLAGSSIANASREDVDPCEAVFK